MKDAFRAGRKKPTVRRRATLAPGRSTAVRPEMTAERHEYLAAERREPSFGSGAASLVLAAERREPPGDRSASRHATATRSTFSSVGIS